MSVRNTVKQAVDDSAIYSLGILLSRAVSILMVPLYTHYLDPTAFGTVEIVVLTSDLVATFLSMQVGGAIIRFYYDAKNPKDLATVMGTGLCLSGVSAILMAGIGAAGSGLLARMLLSNAGQAHLFRIVFLTAAASGVAEVGLLRYRAAQRPLAYVGWSLGTTLIGLSLNIWMIVGLEWGIDGILYSGLITQVVIAAALTAVTVRATGLRLDAALFRSMFLFTYPLAFNGLGSFVVQYSDRFVLRMFAGLDTLGVYGLAYKFALGTNSLLTMPFMGFWSAKGVELHREGRYDQAPEVLRYYLVLWCGAATAVTVFSRQIVALLAPPEYGKAAGMLPVLLLGMLGFTVAQFMAQTLINHKLTGRVARARVLTALLNIGLNFALIPWLGAMGAAVATATTFMVLAALNWWEADRAQRVAYDGMRLARLVGASAALGVAGLTVLPQTSGLAPWIFRGLLLVLIPAVYIMVGAITPREFREAWSLLRSALPLRKG